MLCDGPAAATFGSSYDRHLKQGAEVPRDVATFHVTSSSPLRCVLGVVRPAEQLLAETSAATTMLTSMTLLALATSAVVSADAASTSLVCV